MYTELIYICSLPVRSAPLDADADDRDADDRDADDLAHTLYDALS